MIVLVSVKDKISNVKLNWKHSLLIKLFNYILTKKQNYGHQLRIKESYTCFHFHINFADSKNMLSKSWFYEVE